MKNYLLAALLAISTGAGATTLTFDSLESNRTVSNGYGGLNWSNFYALNAVNYRTSGFKNGVVSPKNVLFNGFGHTASFSSATPFTFNSLDLTAAWNDGLKVFVTGYLKGAVVDIASLVLSTKAPTLETFNWSNIDKVSFVSSGGIPVYQTHGTQFAADNLTINKATVPEPTTVALLGLGLLGFAAARRNSAK